MHWDSAMWLADELFVLPTIEQVYLIKCPVSVYIYISDARMAVISAGAADDRRIG